MSVWNPQDSTKGALHLMGGMPETATKAGGSVWNWSGVSFEFDPNGKLTTSGKPTFSGAGMSAVGIGMTGYFAFQGYREDGVVGAARNLGIDAAVNMSMAQYGYTQLKNSDKIVPKPIWAGAPKALPTVKSGWEWFHPANAAKGLTPLARMAFRQGVGYGVGFGVMNSINGPLGFLAGATAANLATKHAGGFGAAGIALGATYMAGKVAIGAGSSILRAGRQHARLQRQVQTAGDMSSFSTKGAFTMRERAVQAIQKSHLNSRSALGREANFFHSNRNYNSMYR